MTTNHYECLKCGKACDLKRMYPVSKSKCCGAQVKVVSSRDFGSFPPKLPPTD